MVVYSADKISQANDTKPHINQRDLELSTAQSYNLTQFSISLLSTLSALYSTSCILRSTISCVAIEHATVMTSTSSPVFLHLWRNEGIRSVLLSHLDTSSKCALRLTAAECCDLTTQSLFARTRLTFTPSALTRPSRMLHTLLIYISFWYTATDFCLQALKLSLG